MGLVASSAVRELREGGLDRKGGERSFDNGFATIRGPHTQISIRAILSKLQRKKAALNALRSLRSSCKRDLVESRDRSGSLL